MDWLSVTVEAWGTKVVSSILVLQVSLYELGPALSCVRLLEPRRKREGIESMS